MTRLENKNSPFAYFYWKFIEISPDLAMYSGVSAQLKLLEIHLCYINLGAYSFCTEIVI